MKWITAAVLALVIPMVSPEKEKITLWLCGDSTMSIKDPKAWPETGWGMPFVHFWDSTVRVVNMAKNGRSTRSFREEGIWKQVMEGAGTGDYIFIQFGHNDEVPTKKTYTTETDFRNNLKQFVAESKDKKAIPVLLTPMTRRKFDSSGNVEGTHEVYAQITRDVAKEEKVLLLDMDRISQALLQQFGERHSKLLFLHLRPGEHPNYPDGKEDNTHFNELGARLLAQLVLKEIRDKDPGLAGRIIKKTQR